MLMVQGQITTSSLKSYKEKVLEKRKNIEGRTVLIIGDVGLDEYIFGVVDRISQEAPVPVLDVTKEEQRLGLAAYVAQNVASLGATPRLLSVVGADDVAKQLKSSLRAEGVGTDLLIEDSSRPTTRKSRVISGFHHIVRVDHERRKFLSQEMEDRLLGEFSAQVAKCDCVIVEDYGKGVVSERVAQEVIRLAHEAGKEVMVDPHPTTPLGYFRGVDTITPNRNEAFLLAGYKVDDLRHTEDTLIDVGYRLIEQVGAKQVIMTRGKEGMSLFDGQRVVHMPTYAREVFDVVGAGDTVIAALAVARAANFDLEESCVFANYAAGVVVAKVGCQACPIDELVAYIESH